MKLRDIKKGRTNAPNYVDNTNQTICKLQRYNYIPVDFIKCQVIGLDIDHFKQNMDLTFYESKKEGKSNHLFFYKDDINIKCFVDSGRIELSGSIHKYFNEGLHNYNRFTHQDYLTALERLKIDFAVEPKHLRILQLEYGFNVIPPIKTSDILNNLIYHSTTEVKDPQTSKYGNYKQFLKDKYIIKVYDKAKQYQRSNDILRIEIKQRNWSEYRNKYGIVTLEDFNQFDKTLFLDNLLLKWSEIVFYDPTIKGVEKWNKYSNVDFWRHTIFKTSKKSKHHKRLKELNKNKGQNIQAKISDVIIDEVNNLQGVEYSDFSKKRVCKLTGLDISKQRESSFLLSHTGIKQLKHTNPKLYHKIENAYLSDKWQTSSTETRIKEIAHNIRTKYNYISKRYYNQLSMF